MEGLAMRYKNSKGALTKIELEKPHYLFLEPLERVVVRYTITKDGLEENNTNIARQVPDTSLLTVKAIQTESKFITKVIDFENVPSGKIESVALDFSKGDEVFVDVLYESLTTDRLRVKIKVLSKHADSFENENTVTDGPDEFVRVSDVQIKNDAVYFNYIFRRSGRLKKYVGKVEYPLLAQILKERLFLGFYHVDYEQPMAKIQAAIRDAKWFVDGAEREIYKKITGRTVYITDDEIGELIREHALPSEIFGLLTTKNLKESKHFLLRDAQNFLVDCDRACSLPAATPENLTDKRG